MTRCFEDFKKLNLGSGHDWLEDHWNVDLSPQWKSDERIDVFAQLPWPDAHFEEVRAYDILEHTTWFQTERVLEEWLRVLVPSGVFSLKVPDLCAICSAFVNERIDVLTATGLLYGGQEQPMGPVDWRLNAHYAGFDERRLRELATHFNLAVQSLGQLEETNLILIATKG